MLRYVNHFNTKKVKKIYQILAVQYLILYCVVHYVLNNQLCCTYYNLTHVKKSIENGFIK